MSKNPFFYKPTRTILHGDKELAATHTGDAKRILFQLKNIQANNGSIKELSKVYEDGTVINVHSKVKGMDVINIIPRKILYKVEEKEEVIECTEEFPVPIIGLVSNFDSGFSDDIIGAFVAKEFHSNFFEYVKADKNVEIKYVRDDRSLEVLQSVGSYDYESYHDEIDINGHIRGTFNPPASSSHSINYLGPCEPGQEEYGPSCDEDNFCTGENLKCVCPCPNICPPCSDCSPDPLCPWLGCNSYKKIYSYGACTIYDSPLFLDYHIHSAEYADKKRYEPYSYVDVYNPAPDFHTGTEVCGLGQYGVWCSEGENTLLKNHMGYGEPDSQALSYSSSGTFSHNASYGWGIIGFDIDYTYNINLSGKGATTFEIGGNNFTWTSSCGGDINWSYYYHFVFWDTGEKKHYIMLRCTQDVNVSHDHSDSCFGLPYLYGKDSVCGSYYDYKKAVFVENLFVRTDTKEYLINTTTLYGEKLFDYDSDGEVAIFDFNGKPFYMYVVYWGIEVEDDILHPENITFEYGCIYNDKRSAIQFKGVGTKLARNFSMKDAVLIDNDGNKKNISLPDDVKEKFGGTWRCGIDILAGKYVVKNTVKVNI